MSDPLILSTSFDPVSFARLETDRRRHFPPAQNRIPAHLTLFHQLPGEGIEEISRWIAASAEDNPPVPFTAVDLRFLGRGVAIEIAAPKLLPIRAGLARHFADTLTAQDRQGFRPHVTIQNKVPPERARALFDARQAAHEPWQGTITGLDLWFYRGGPWERAGAWLFSGARGADEPEPHT